MGQQPLMILDMISSGKSHKQHFLLYLLLSGRIIISDQLILLLSVKALVDLFNCLLQQKMDLNAPILYNDKDIKIRQSGLTIKCYYFPTCTSKRIPISQIKQVKLVQKCVYRSWGLGYKLWFALDSDRFDRHNFIAIDTGSSIQPAFTCTNNHEAYKILNRLVEAYRNQTKVQDSQEVPLAQ